MALRFVAPRLSLAYPWRAACVNLRSCHHDVVKCDSTLSTKSPDKAEVSEFDCGSFELLPLTERIKTRLKSKGFHSMFEIQAKAIPLALSGKDIIGRARTGGGKTLGYAIPILQKLTKTPSTGRARALLILPTRELSHQVADVIASLEPQLKIAQCVGGGSVFEQFTALRNVDVVIGTPGRLAEFHLSGDLTLDHVQFLVLDEADMMMDREFMIQLEKIVEQLPRRRQTMLFSATMSRDVMLLSEKYMQQPVSVDVTTQAKRVPSTIEHISMDIEEGREVASILYLLETYKPRRTLVFVQKKVGADQLSAYLRDCGVSCSTLHSNKSQSERNATVKQFKLGGFELLVATDVASRGIDIPGIELVIHVGLPPAREGINPYVHRAGRTGRGGATGVSVLLHYNDTEYLAKLSQVVDINPAKPPKYDLRHSASQPWLGFVRLNGLIAGSERKHEPKRRW